MSPEKSIEINELGPTLPKEGLRIWVEGRYKDKTDRYGEDLKNVHIRAIEEEDVLALENLSNVLFVEKSFLQSTSPEEYAHLTNLYDRLIKWLKPRLENI
ncbi:MAG: hypothetical protein A2735_01925 [Candidatus Yanofskybacteria bacterium RIFCSPHIGHO2_01_FULL_41_21]|uniref:Uncharacterized protein n=1 Tax=Candidatus Yanofskybacteria bacterium RIFCSPHIGHO2_01_FULL_41_21 TaxID=1802660 RepID=A0A1F8E9Q5_9BACT|nr:MAG: hypothetical protein A2735_01925 [Candidatus Yanofskybacteria bacterium RIFCSPHIGHO2_01_FULL_41_21]